MPDPVAPMAGQLPCGLIPSPGDWTQGAPLTRAEPTMFSWGYRIDPCWLLDSSVHSVEVAISFHERAKAEKVHLYVCLTLSSVGNSKNKNAYSLRENSCLGGRNSIETKKIAKNQFPSYFVPLCSVKHLYHLDKIVFSSRASLSRFLLAFKKEIPTGKRALRNLFWGSRPQWDHNLKD